jgi:Tol biopolymer transport system component/DNA-binding winged helix-turn-helix (wHTH) protein
MQQTTETNFSFGEFEVDATKRLLFKDGQTVRLKSKTFDLLLILIERRGEVLSKNDLLDLVWTNQYVEENNLTVHVAALRKVLGETKNEHRFIVTVPGQGYKFVGELNDGNRNIMFETRTLSRIVIEEEEARNETALPSAGRFRVSFKKWQIALAFLVLLAVLGTAGYVWRSGRKTNAMFQVASITRLTTSGKIGFALALSPDGKLYAYSLKEGGKESLWLGHVDGGEPFEIFQPVETVFWSLTFAPDGSSLYYTSSPDLANGSLYRLPVFGGAPEKIKDTGRNPISFAPDGKRFVFVHDDRETGKRSLVIAKTDSADEQVIAPGNLEISLNSPAWSPDGETIAFGAAIKSSNSEVLLLNPADGTIKPLTAHGWRNIRSIRWRSDENGLIVVADEKESVVSQLWQVSYPSGEASRILADLNLYAFSFGFSADNRELLTVQSQTQTNIWVAPADDLTRAKQITFSSIGRNEGGYGLNWLADGRLVYTAVVDKSQTIWTMDADGRNQKQLIPSGGNSIYPGTDGRGRYVVFQSNRSGNSAVWRADADGGNLVNLTGSEKAGEPSISPDGKWIVYVTSSDYLGDLYRIPVTGGEPVRLSDKKAAWAAVSPDSRLVACGYEVDGTMKLAVIPIEGGEPLKLFDIPRLAMFRPGLRWLPDGKAIAYRDQDNGIWQQNLDGGEPQHLTVLPPERLYGYGWSPDGKYFAFTRGVESRDVVLINGEK